MDKIGSWIFLCILCFEVYSTSDAIDCSKEIIPEEQRSPCGLQTTLPQDEAQCLAVGNCCWNESAATKNRCYTRKDSGACMLYKGEACKDSINNTLSDQRETPRFFDNKYGLTYTEFFLAKVTALIDSEISDPECKYLIRNLFCHYTLTPCNTEGTSTLPFCKEDCLAIFKKCQTPLGYAVGFVKTIIFTERVNFVHTGLPNCSIYRFEKEYDPAKNETCIRTGFFNYTAEPIGGPGNEDDNTLVKILVPIIVAVMLVVSVVVIWLYLRRKDRKHQALKNSKLIAFGSGSMNMREKLKADSMKSLDSRLLRLFDPDKLKQYPLDEVEYVKDLGEGHFGKVYHGRAIGLVPEEPTKVIPIAVKALKEGSNKETKDEFLREVTLMSILDHKNIVRLLAVCTEEEPYGMIFEFMKHGDLNQYLRSAKSAEKSLDDPVEAKVYLTQEDLLSASVQIATGMEYLAKLRFVHRDLATRNCLVDDDLVIKIADFGMSRDLYSSDYYKMTHETMLPIRWLSPEAFLYGKFTVKSDVYAFAVCLWEVYTFGLQPYYGYTNKEVIEFIKKGIHLGKPENCPPHVYALMKNCWAWYPADRPEFSSIVSRLQDPYGNYDKPGQKARSTDNIDAAEPNFGNYDVPKGQVENYDIPKGPNENYDTPKGSSREALDNGPKSPLDSYSVPRMTLPDEGFQDEKYDIPRKDSSPTVTSHLIVDSDEHKLNPKEMVV